MRTSPRNGHKDVKSLRVAVIGCGMIAREAHLPSLCSFNDVEVVAVCDKSRKVAHETTKKFGIQKFYQDYERMLKATQPDCVYVLTPPQQMFDAVVVSIEMGADVFLEKPPGITVEQTRNMARLAREKDRVTMVGFNRRFIPLLAETKRRIEETGRITQCTVIYHKNLLNQPPYFSGAVDFMTSDVIHAVDALRWICGEAECVASSIETHGKQYATGFSALIEFQDGVVGHLCANLTAGDRIHVFYIHAAGISGFVDISVLGNGNKALLFTGKGTEEVIVNALEGKTEWHEIYGFDQENRHFLESVRGRTQPVTSLGDSVKTMELVDWIFRAQIGAAFYVR